MMSTHYRSALAATGLAMLLLPAFSGAASFDCAKAGTRIEKQICADESLSQLDEYLGRHYAGAHHALPAAHECLRADQRMWLRTRNQCAEATCLKEQYLIRLATLDALQPGANALRDVPLPQVPALVWVIPPAEDQIAVPRTHADIAPTDASTHSGTVENALEDGGELSLLAESGERIALVQLMSADGSTVDRLIDFARSGTQLDVRGVVLQEGDAFYFDPSRCVFLSENPQAHIGR